MAACAVSWASGSCSPVCPLGVLCCVCGVLGLPAPVHRCARSVCCVACAVSWASGSCSPVCPLNFFNLFLSSRVGTTSHLRFLKLRFQFQGHLDQFFALPCLSWGT